MVRAAAEMAAHSIPCRIIPLEANRVHGGRALQRRVCNQGAGYPEREQKDKSRCAHEHGRHLNGAEDLMVGRIAERFEAVDAESARIGSKRRKAMER